MSNTNPALHPLYLAIGAISGGALFRSWLKYKLPVFLSDGIACLAGYSSLKKSVNVAPPLELRAINNTFQIWNGRVKIIKKLVCCFFLLVLFEEEIRYSTCKVIGLYVYF